MLTDFASYHRIKPFTIRTLLLKAYYITLIAIFSNLVFDFFLKMTFSLFFRFVGGPLKKVTKIID